MPDLLIFSRNKSTSVEQLDDQTIKSTCRLQDTFTNGFIGIIVKLPELEIKEVTGKFSRTLHGKCLDLSEAFKKIVGVRIGPGMSKIIRGIADDATECRHFGCIVEECCHGVILSLTKDAMLLIPEGYELTEDDYKNLVKSNIRLYNRCAAFAPGSRIVEGVEPP